MPSGQRTGESPTVQRRLRQRGDAVVPSLDELRQLTAGYRQVFEALAHHARVIEINTDAPPHASG